MARIRTIKPEFWTDDLLGSVCREARLLFIATWNMADDEGLLRWSAPFLKGAVFPFDDDLSVVDVQNLMAEIEDAGIIFAYRGGRSQQALAYVVNFHKHQKINRPSPSRLPPPQLGETKVKDMYAARDGQICHLCSLPVDANWSKEYEGDFTASPDHLKPQAQGGTDFPSNIRTAHLTCNKGRRDRTPDEYREVLRAGKSAAQKRYPDRFTYFSSTDSVSRSVPEREMEQDHGAGNEEQETEVIPESNAQERPTAKEPANEPRTKLHPGWRPEVDDRDYASDKGLDPESVTAAFVDYFAEGRGRNEKRTLAGWSKRYRIWCNTDAERKGPARGGEGVRSSAPGGDAGAFARAAARVG